MLRITGGNDKQGFPMRQGILTNGRVKLLLKKSATQFRSRRKGYRRRKSVHGCIVDGSLSVLNLSIVKKGDGDIPGEDGYPSCVSMCEYAYLLGVLFGWLLFLPFLCV